MTTFPSHFLLMMPSFCTQLTTVSLDDAKTLTTSVLIYAAFRYIMTHYVFAPLGNILNVEKKRNYKWSNRCFDTLHYTISAIIGLAAVLTRPYARTIAWAYNYPLILLNSPAFECSILEKCYIINFICYYIVDVFYVASATDKFLICVHHVATLSLIFGSIYIHQGPVCTVIMALHDIVDVPLYVGKIATYLHKITIKQISLLYFAVACTWFRIINYPIIAAHAVSIMNDVQYKPQACKVVVFFLWVLYSCHIKWFIDILKAVLEIIQHKPDAIRDNRSD